MINLFNEWILIRRGSTGWIRIGLSVDEWERNGSKNYIKMEYRRVYIEKMVFYI